jgi:hypothetical protein
MEIINAVIIFGMLSIGLVIIIWASRESRRIK